MSEVCRLTFCVELNAELCESNTKDTESKTKQCKSLAKQLELLANPNKSVTKV